MRFLLLSLVLIATAFGLQAQGTWAPRAPLPSGRSISAAFSLNGKGYLSTGLYATTATPWRNDLMEYNIATGTWTQKADFPGVGRHSAVAFTLNQKAYVGLGTYQGGWASDFYRYDPATDTWTRIADLPGIGVTMAAAFSIGNRAYAGIGTGNMQYSRALYEYNDSTNTWTRKADFPGTASSKAGTFVANGKGYIVCGLNLPGSGSSFSKQLWEFDPIANTWTRKADFPGEGRNTPVVLNLDGRILVGMGDAQPSFDSFTDMYEYLPATDTWTLAASFPGSGRSRAAAFSIGRRGFAGTGLGTGNNGLTDWWEFSFSPVAVSPKQPSAFQVWPNPTSGRLHFTAAPQGGISVFNALSGLAMQIRPGAETADLSALPKGLYWLRSAAGVQRIVLE